MAENNQEEIEQLVQENVQHKNVSFLKRKNIRIGRVCCIKISSSWRIQRQIICAFLILIGFTLGSSFAIIIPTMDQIKKELFLNNQFHLQQQQIMVKFTRLFEQSIQTFVDESQKNANNLAHFYKKQIENQQFSAITTPNLVQASQKKEFLQSQDNKVLSNLCVEYYSGANMTEDNIYFKATRLLSHLVLTGIINSDTMNEIAFEKEDLLIKYPADFNQETLTRDYKNEDWYKQCKLDTEISGVSNNQLIVDTNQNYQLFIVKSIVDSSKQFQGCLRNAVPNEKIQKVIANVISSSNFTSILIVNQEGKINRIIDFFEDLHIFEQEKTGFNQEDYRQIKTLSVQGNLSSVESRCEEELSMGFKNQILCFSNRTSDAHYLIYSKNLTLKPKEKAQDFILIVILDDLPLDGFLDHMDESFQKMVTDQIEIQIITIIIFSLFMVCIMYFVLSCILRPFKQIVKFTKQIVGKEETKRKKLDVKNLQLSDISGRGLVGNLVDAYKRLFQGSMGLKTGNQNEICQAISNLQYPRKQRKLDQLIDWKENINNLTDYQLDIEKMGKFIKEWKMKQQEYKLNVQKVKYDRKQSYDFFVQQNQKDIDAFIHENQMNEKVQEAILKMIVFDTKGQKKIQELQ